jgi:restriction system protein
VTEFAAGDEFRGARCPDAEIQGTHDGETPGMLNWREFERRVGEAFRRQGFTVTGFGGNGPDGSVDLGLTKNGKRFLVQCQHWCKPQVGVTVVRELHAVMAVQRAHGGFVVTDGQFSREAKEFADLFAIKLIDGVALAEMLQCTFA